MKLTDFSVGKSSPQFSPHTKRSFAEKVLRVFPTPHALAESVAGVSISDSAVRAIRFAPYKGELSLESYGSEPLSEGAIVEGRINNRDDVVAALKKLKDRLRLDAVRTSAPEEKAYLFELDLPIVPPKNLRGSIEFKLEENVPLPADQVVFDYEVVSLDHALGTLRAVVSVLPVKAVEVYTDVCAAAGLNLLGLSIESQAIARATLHPDDLGSYIIVEIAPGHMIVSVVSRGLVRFTSSISLDQTDHTVSSVSSVASEIGKVLSYWHTNKETEGAISRILLCGESAVSSQSLGEHLDVPVELANVWLNVCDVSKNPPRMSFEESLVYAPAVGLALPSRTLV